MTRRAALTIACGVVVACFGVIITATPKHPGLAAAAAIVGFAGIVVFLTTCWRVFPASRTRRPR